MSKTSNTVLIITNIVLAIAALAGIVVSVASMQKAKEANEIARSAQIANIRILPKTWKSSFPDLVLCKQDTSSYPYRVYSMLRIYIEFSNDGGSPSTFNDITVRTMKESSTLDNWDNIKIWSNYEASEATMNIGKIAPDNRIRLPLDIPARQGRSWLVTAAESHSYETESAAKEAINRRFGAKDDKVTVKWEFEFNNVEPVIHVQDMYSKFDSERSRPITAKCGDVITGWQAVLGS